MLLTISSDGMLIDAYFFELTACAKLHRNDIYPPKHVLRSSMIESCFPRAGTCTQASA